MNMVGELLINKTRLQSLDIQKSKFNEIIPQLDRVTMELHHIVMQIRMVPVGVMFSRFPRMIRDLSNKMNKEIDFIMEGQETELDRSIIDELSDPLTHLLRNAIDHGIEKPEERKAKGKDEEGQIKLRAYQKGSEIIIEVKDDGAGIDADIIGRKAVEKGIVSEEELEQAYEENKEAFAQSGQENTSFENLKPQIEEMLKQQRQSQAINQYLEKLREDAEIEKNI